MRKENEMKKERIGDALEFVAVFFVVVSAILILLAFEPFGLFDNDTKMVLLSVGALCVPAAFVPMMFSL